MSEGQSFPDELRDISEQEAQERAQRLEHEAQESAAELEAEQAEVLEAIGEEHGGDLIESTVTLPGDHQATVSVDLNGELIDRLADIDSRVASLEDAGPGEAQEIPNAIRDIADLLADSTVEARYSGELFETVYLEHGPVALVKVAEKIFGAVKEQKERQEGAIDGFRGE